MRFHPRRAPLRLATGAFVLSAGLDKWHGDEQTAAQLHGFARGTYPFLNRIESRRFLRMLSAGEIAVGSTLLLPVVPAAVAGAALTGFSAGLLGLYLRTPGMRRGRWDPRSTPEGLPLSKDVWMLGAGLALLIDALTANDGPARRPGGRSRGAGRPRRSSVHLMSHRPSGGVPMPRLRSRPAVTKLASVGRILVLPPI